MASAVMDNAKAFANENLATLRVKLNQIPALQQVEVRECPALKIRVLSSSGIGKAVGDVGCVGCGNTFFNLSIVTN